MIRYDFLETLCGRLLIAIDDRGLESTWTLWAVGCALARHERLAAGRRGAGPLPCRV